MRGWGVLVGALAMLAGGAAAQERAIQVVNPYAAGSTTDLLARALVPGLQARLGVPVLVVNREGAAGGIGTASVARAAPDGTTLLFAPAVVLSVMPALRRDAGYTAEGFTPVCQTFENAMVLAVREDSPWTGLAALVAAAKAQPGALRYGHQGIASVPHLAAVEFAELAGIALQDVSYRGEPAVVLDLLAGRVEFAALVAGSLSGQRLRALAIFAEARHPLLPQAPTAKEQGFDLAPASFGGLLAPAGLPEATRATLARACEGAAADPAYAEAARRAFQPEAWFAGSDAFAARLAKDVNDKARLLARIDVQR
jgi:tripartite-type tricarboxylate transporter receptor subunit TctC